MKRASLVSAATLGSVAALLVAGGSAWGWTLPSSFPPTPLSASHVKATPLPPSKSRPGQSRPAALGHCVRFPEPTNCEHPTATPATPLPNSSPRLEDCLDSKTPPRDLATRMRICGKGGKGYVLTFGK